MKHAVLALALVSPAFLSGCVISVGGDGDSHYSSDWQDREYNNRKHISRLEPDMTFESVVKRMGVADFSERYQKEESDYRVLFYRTQKLKGDGVTTKDECSPLVFKDGALVGWGEQAYSQF